METKESFDLESERLKKRFERPKEKMRRSLAMYRTLQGEALAHEINASNPDLVLDIGCGANYFKSHIKNVIGIDMAVMPEIDLELNIKDLDKVFAPKSADWILCFGPLNYGQGESWATTIIDQMKYLLKDNGTIVLHTQPMNSNILWTEETINEWGSKYGFKQTQPLIGYTEISKMDEKDRAKQQEFAEWDGRIAQEIEAGNKYVNPMTVWRWRNEK